MLSFCQGQQHHIPTPRLHGTPGHTTCFSGGACATSILRRVGGVTRRLIQESTRLIQFRPHWRVVVAYVLGFGVGAVGLAQLLPPANRNLSGLRFLSAVAL